MELTTGSSTNSGNPCATPISRRVKPASIGLQLEHMDLAKPEAIVMHPGPINRGRELSSEVADFQRSVILNQVENGIAVRMAVLEKVIG